jgi:hypothetical protein
VFTTVEGEKRLDRLLRPSDRRKGFGAFRFNGRERHVLFVNAGGRRFVEGGYPLGIDVDLEGRGVAVADLDQDGALDLLVRNHARQKLSYFHNEVGSQGHFVRVDLVGTRSNRDAIGAVVRLEAGGLRQMRVKMAGNGFQSQSEPTVHFGIGGALRPERLEIRWPSGLVERFADVPADRLLRIVEGEGRFEAKPMRGRRRALERALEAEKGKRPAP